MSPPRARTMVVVSSDSDRRRDWGHELERTGLRVVRCAARACPLVSGGTCDLLATADAAVYDEDTLRSELFLGLVSAPSCPTVLYTRDPPPPVTITPRFTRVLDHGGAATTFPHLR
jgi:hypothetical protein